MEGLYILVIMQYLF